MPYVMQKNKAMEDLHIGTYDDEVLDKFTLQQTKTTLSVLCQVE